MSEKFVECDVDGKQSPAFICHHLDLDSRDLGFHEPDDGKEPETDLQRYNGWCEKCDNFLIKNGGQWDDQTEAYAQIYLICSACYQRIKQNNIGNNDS